MAFIIRTIPSGTFCLESTAAFLLLLVLGLTEKIHIRVFVREREREYLPLQRIYSVTLFFTVEGVLLIL